MCFLLMVNSERFLVSASVIFFGMTLWRDFIFFLTGRELFEEQILSILSSGDQSINGI